MSIIHVQIVTYNSERTIQTCLQSVLNQARVDFSVTVIDNASSDNTVATVESLGIECITNGVNIGYAAAQNQALTLSDSRYVLTLNPDVCLVPDYLWHLQQALDRETIVGSAAGCLLRVDHLAEEPKTVDSTGLFIRRNRRQGLLDEGLPVQQAYQTQRYIFGPDGAAAFYRRAMLDDVSVKGEVFDPDFFMHKEDIDVCWRAQLRGWRSIYVPEAVAHHIRGFRPGQRQYISDALRCYAIRNRYLLMLKNEVPVHFWHDILHIGFYDLRVFGYILLRERKSLRAYKSAWQLRHRMLEKRHIIQRRRTVDWRYIRQTFQ
jgi:GT2 family glycosyltransferase